MAVNNCACGHAEGDHQSNRSRTNPQHGICLTQGCDCRQFQRPEYLLLMRGDRLAPEIQDGDHLTVRHQNHAKPGQLVVAMVGGGARIQKCGPGDEVIGLVTTVMRRLP